MHGLRCSHALPGFTRLLDEWVVGLTRYASGPGVFDEPERFAQTVADAATRVRAFAYGEGEVPPTRWENGATSFELQGYEYGVGLRTLDVRSPDGYAGAVEAALGDALTAAPERPDHTRLGMVLVRVEREEGVGPGAYRDVTRSLGCSAAAWSFPTPDEGPEFDYAGVRTLGGVILVQAAAR